MVDLSAWFWSRDRVEERSQSTQHRQVAWERNIFCYNKLLKFCTCGTASNNLKCSYEFKNVLDLCVWVIFLVTCPASSPATCWYQTAACLSFFSMLFCLMCCEPPNSLCHPCCFILYVSDSSIIYYLLPYSLESLFSLVAWTTQTLHLELSSEHLVHPSVLPLPVSMEISNAQQRPMMWWIRNHSKLIEGKVHVRSNPINTPCLRTGVL